MLRCHLSRELLLLLSCNARIPATTVKIRSGTHNDRCILDFGCVVVVVAVAMAVSALLQLQLQLFLFHRYAIWIVDFMAVSQVMAVLSLLEYSVVQSFLAKVRAAC